MTLASMDPFEFCIDVVAYEESDGQLVNLMSPQTQQEYPGMYNFTTADVFPLQGEARQECDR